jgi:fructose-1,6-bisphosphatase/inositol monophosphatase family enzyme
LSFSADDLLSLAKSASDAARSAGALIASSRPRVVEHKAGELSPAAQVVTEVDRAAEARILEVLAPTIERHDIAVLTEEREDDGGRQQRSCFWCIDPLDGTLPFVEDVPGYAVSIALVSRDGRPLLGVAYNPTDDVLYRAVVGQGAWRDDAPLRASPAAPHPRQARLSVYADRSFATAPSRDAMVAGLEEVSTALSLDGVDVRIGAGAVVNAVRVLEGGPACYFKLPSPKPGGGSLWDFAATACIAREAGAVATDMAGDPLDLNRGDSTFMNHRGVLFASSEHIARLLRARSADWG